MSECTSIKAKIEEFLNNKEYEKPTHLCSLMTALGSDKGNGHHNYTTLYSKLFQPLKDCELKIFELGIGTNNLDVPSNMGFNGFPGASLWAWSAYFPNSHIYGADVDRRILFNIADITTYYCDQRNPKSIQKMFSKKDLKNVKFNIIIDDGLHTFKANFNFLMNSIHKLKEGGIYIVEDLCSDACEEFNKILSELKISFGLHYIEIVKIPIDIHKNLLDDNALLIIQK